MTAITAAVHPLPPATAVPSASGNNNGAAGASTISANDFLTLLVTEMKNQDPTAQTDPNEYINQLVQVNSLEQLIQINQELSGALQPACNGGTGSGSGQAVDAAQSAMSAGKSDSGLQSSEPRGATTLTELYRAPAVSGNLSVPAPIPAAQHLAQALSGRT